MTSKNLSILYKVLFAFLGFSAVVTEIATLVERGTFAPGNFFSYFTIESNILAVIVFMISALAIACGKVSKNIELLRGASALYMATTGIVFSTLLANLDPAVLTAVPWDNTVLHYIIPIAVVADWLIYSPKHRVAFKKAIIWLAFPIAYVIYSLIRGAYVGWYPYPFLDPATNGYGGVAIVSVGITAVVLAVIWLLTRFPLGKR